MTEQTNSSTNNTNYKKQQRLTLTPIMRASGNKITLPSVVLVSTLVSLVLILTINANGAHANPLQMTASQTSGHSTLQQQHRQPPLRSRSSRSQNDLENLIYELLDEDGNRLKKSKLNSVRQIKQTLRFGRRSDPLMAPESFSGQSFKSIDSTDDLERDLPALEDD